MDYAGVNLRPSSEVPLDQSKAYTKEHLISFFQPIEDCSRQILKCIDENVDVGPLSRICCCDLSIIIAADVIVRNEIPRVAYGDPTFP